MQQFKWLQQIITLEKSQQRRNKYTRNAWVVWIASDEIITQSLMTLA